MEIKQSHVRVYTIVTIITNNINTINCPIIEYSTYCTIDADIILHAANKSFPLEYESIFILK